MSPVVRWQRLPVERKLHWLLRVGVIGCFIGHGAYGVLTKEAWVPYFGVIGIDCAWAYRLMWYSGSCASRPAYSCSATVRVVRSTASPG
jgi:hypothetical protein